MTPLLLFTSIRFLHRPRPARLQPSGAIARRRSGFSLIETAIATGIIASVLLAVLALLPLATSAGVDAASKTAVGTLLEDFQERIEGEELSPTLSTPIVFFYDEGGTFVDPTSSTYQPIDRRYRAEAHLVEPTGQWYQPSDPDDTALALQVRVFWPVNPNNGDAMGEVDPQTGEIPPQSKVTYFVNTLTGRDWPNIDSSYRPKIEY